MGYLHRHFHRHFLSLILLAAVAIFVLSAQSSDAAGRERTFTIKSTVPTITYIDLANPGKGAGDRYIFHSRLLRDGRQIGRLHGIKDTIRLDRGTEVVQNLLTFQFRGNGSIVVAGITRLSSDGRHEAGLIFGRPFERAIIGGTGRFKNVTGTLISTRLDSGNYRQRFEVVFPEVSDD